MKAKAKTIKILFFGDLVGRVGRRAVGKYLTMHRENYDFVVANVENASHGFGLTPKNYQELSDYGIDAFTSGNHIWDKCEVFEYIKTADKLVVPINYPKKVPGRGCVIFEVGKYKIAVMNALGRVFMQPLDSPWEILEKEIKKVKKITPNVLIDFHAEATAEKICLGKYCANLGVSAFIGTHTHVQTADDEIIKNTAYITDVGFCGAKDSVIGMDYETSLKRFVTGLPERYEVSTDSTAIINAVEITVDGESGVACDIKRIYELTENKKEKEACCDNAKKR